MYHELTRKYPNAVRFSGAAGFFMKAIYNNQSVYGKGNLWNNHLSAKGIGPGYHGTKNWSNTEFDVSKVYILCARFPEDYHFRFLSAGDTLPNDAWRIPGEKNLFFATGDLKATLNDGKAESNEIPGLVTLDANFKLTPLVSREYGKKVSVDHIRVLCK